MWVIVGFDNSFSPTDRYSAFVKSALAGTLKRLPATSREAKKGVDYAVHIL